MRGGEARYFTFVVMGDSMRFSETGAQFLSDMLSKHAMHANCSEEVCKSPIWVEGPAMLSNEPISYRPVRHCHSALHWENAQMGANEDHYLNCRCCSLPQVLFAGEFCVLSSLTQPGGYRFIVDNNSGTFAPPPSCLAAMGELLRFNFPGLEVEVRLPVWYACLPACMVRLPAWNSVLNYIRGVLHSCLVFPSPCLCAGDQL